MPTERDLAHSFSGGLGVGPDTVHFLRQRAEDRGQRTEGRGQRTEERAEGRRQKTEGSRQTVAERGKAEDVDGRNKLGRPVGQTRAESSIQTADRNGSGQRAQGRGAEAPQHGHGSRVSIAGCIPMQLPFNHGTCPLIPGLQTTLRT